MENKGLSVIICCYNGAERLPETIKHIALQDVPSKISWELIIVNNNSTDNTAEVALSETLKYTSLSTRYKIVNEPNAGLSHARHKGVAVSKYEHIIFCDDDNWLGENYLTTAYEILSGDEKIAAVGGQSEAVSDISFPDWWEDYKGGYAVGKQAETTGDVSYRKFLWGSGLAFKKKLFLHAFNKLPSLLSDRKGNELTSGGDSEICMRFLLMGYKLYYSEALTFKHYIEPFRLSWSYRKNLFDGFEKSKYILNIYVKAITIERYSNKEKCFLFVKSLLKVLIAKLLNRSRFYSNAEADQIYLISGFKLEKTSNCAKEIRSLINGLALK